MKRYKIRWNEVQADVAQPAPAFPKYATQIMNLANQNAQGTRPRVVGQMTELIQEFPGESFPEWVSWYEARMPAAISLATDKVLEMIESFQVVVQQIDRDMVREWVRDLVLSKTYTGIRFQDCIISSLADQTKTTYRRSSPEEESKGIDGYLGNEPISVKPVTYRHKPSLTEELPPKVVYYDKKKDGITVYVEWL